MDFTGNGFGGQIAERCFVINLYQDPCRNRDLIL